MTALAIPRPRRIRPAAFLAAAIAVAVGSYLVSAVGAPARPAPPTPSPALEAPGGPSSGTVASLTQIDHSIRAWSANVQANDRDFISATNLGLLYHARGRLTGDVGDYGRALAGLDRALAIYPSYAPARTLHALVLQVTHDFAGALAEAQTLYKEDPRQAQALATIGDSQLELGDYTGAAKSYRELDTLSPGPAITARLAHLAWLQGDGVQAEKIARRAHDQARAAGTTGPGLGWYDYLAGTIAFQTGDLAEAARWYDAAAADWPDSYLVLAGQGRLAAAEGRTDDAIALYRRAIAVAPQPDALAALGDLYELRGQTKLAEQQYATVRVIARLAAVNQQVYNRQLVLFEVNHGTDLPEALRLAEAELVVRKDIYGYDAYAWALLANGRAAEADRAIAQALALGTRDAQLLYHAGLIAQAVGDAARARTLLNDALALNPGFDPLGALRARAALEELR